jgi:hypothetical protein
MPKPLSRPLQLHQQLVPLQVGPLCFQRAWELVPIQ